MVRQAAVALLFVCLAKIAWAQSWIQIEARPGATQALERADAYAQVLQDVNAFRLRSGWHAIALGPYEETEARQRLLDLRAQRLVPNDSFVADGRGYRDRIFGAGRQSAALAPSEPAEPLPELVPGEETVNQARQGERGLSREDRALLQTALKWDGFYNSVIDASFGPGTRRAMAAWQEANGFEATGVLTTLQRRQLLDAYRAVQASIGLAPVSDFQAGIDLDLPMALVKFDRHEAPFAHYLPTTDDDIRIVLISQTGDQDTLTALYDIMQTLAVVPVDGPRNLGRDSFTIEGRNSKIVSYTFARRAGDAIKGFSISWPVADEKRFGLALNAMRASFTTTDNVLPDTAGRAQQDIDLLSGLEIRRPTVTRSGFFIDQNGTVLTTTDAVRGCARITLETDVPAIIAAQNNELGLALLTPTEALSPLRVASLSVTTPRIASDVAVAGYSFGGLLSAPSVTFGTLADLKDLEGDRRLQRLDIVTEPSDAGGPVFDSSGAIMGMLLDKSRGNRKLPDDVAFSVNSTVLAAFLAENDVNPAAQDTSEALAPEDLSLRASDMTVLVSCWD